ncbi:hypothetical protein [Streptomyces sp. PD-S100-1]|uniref:hypothetical protein n=1 Tax=Streptomyces sp. PD-S100-1 TaxID=3394351 RepID=UPI0039BD07F2
MGATAVTAGPALTGRGAGAAGPDGSGAVGGGGPPGLAGGRGRLADGEGAAPAAPLVFAGTPEAVAGELAAFVRAEGVDGFVLVPCPVPGAGLDDFVDRVVPLLQRAGAFRTRYEGATLRAHLGLATRPYMEGLIT